MNTVGESKRKERYGAVIVAAGMSTRMKQFKQMMKIGDMSLAERVIVNFRSAGVEDIVMVTGYNADKLEKSLRQFDITFLRNEDYEHTQMFDSVKIGLEYINGRCDRIFFCPVDVPFFMDTTVEVEKQIDADVIVPTYNGRDGHPLLIRNAVIPHILEHDGSRGLKGAYESLSAGSVRRIQVNDEGAVIDADTKEDFCKLVDLHNNRLLHLNVELSICSTTTFCNSETYELLRKVEQEGNVREACERVGISYSKGWQLIKDCESKFGAEIVARRQGGQYGGAAAITDKGLRLLQVYKELAEELSEIGEERFQQKMRKYELIQEQR